MLFARKKMLISLLRLTLGLLILLVPVAPHFAEGNRANQGYTPPKKDKKQQRAVNSGSRIVPTFGPKVTPLCCSYW